MKIRRIIWPMRRNKFDSTSEFHISAYSIEKLVDKLDNIRRRFRFDKFEWNIEGLLCRWCGKVFRKSLSRSNELPPTPSMNGRGRCRHGVETYSSHRYRDVGQRIQTKLRFAWIGTFLNNISCGNRRYNLR